MKKHLNVEVFGIVQGVSYRYSTHQQATMLGVQGFVKNRSDGSVYLEAEGDEEVLEKLVQWCHRGPEWAKVDKVIVQEGEMQDYINFNIRY